MLKTTLEQWRMFQAVAEAGGFSQAADVVHKSQSTIHHSVQKLEETLGIALFETRGRRVFVTAAGETMLRRSAYLLNEAEKIEQLAGQMGAGVESELSIAVDHAFPAELIHRAIAEVTNEYELLCINLRETVLSGANEWLESGEVDLAVSPLEIAGAMNEEICMVNFIAVAAPGHPLADSGVAGGLAQKPITLEALKSHRQIVVRDSARETNTSEGWLGAEQRWTVDHLRTSVDLVSRGLGFAWLPESLILEQLARGTLDKITLGAHGVRRVGFYLNFADADRLGPAARTFMGALRRLTLQAPAFESSQGETPSHPRE